MNKGDVLTQLVDQAACCINMLSPTDLSEAQQLAEIFNQIGKVVREYGRGPGELRTQLEGTTSDAAGLLQKILQQDADDASTALEAISKAICSLQDLIRRLENPEAEAKDAAPPGTEEITISEEDAPLVLDFISEANEHLENAESALLELENHPDDGELINRIFRGFHTIKGMAGFLNLIDIGSLAHSGENLLDLARQGKLVLADDNSEVVFESIDMLKKVIGALAGAVESGAPMAAQVALPILLEKLKAAAEGRTPRSP